MIIYKESRPAKSEILFMVSKRKWQFRSVNSFFYFLMLVTNFNLASKYTQT